LTSATSRSRSEREDHKGEGGEDRCHGGAPQSEEGKYDEKGGHLVGKRGCSIYLDKSWRDVIGRPLRNFTKERYGLEARRKLVCRRKM
jgi:hypothetical protein